MIATSDTPSLQNTLERWASYLTYTRGLSRNTVQRYCFLVQRLLMDRGEPLTRDGVEEHLKRLRLSGRGAATILATVAAIKSFCEYAVAHGALEANPVQRLAGPRRYRREAAHLSVAEMRDLLYSGGRLLMPSDPVGARDSTLLAVVYFAGLRVSEPGKLRVEELAWNEERATYSILVRSAKWAAEDARIELDRECSRLLGAYLAIRPRLGVSPWLFPSQRGLPLSRWAVEDIFHRQLVRAGIAEKGRRLSPHCLRHSIATHLLQAGWSPRDVQQHLRHKSIQTTSAYLHLTGDGRVAANWRKRHPLSPKRARHSLAAAGRQFLADLR
jgi:site-specific recombinase XerD